jgi:hypothetical protein
VWEESARLIMCFCGRIRNSSLRIKKTEVLVKGVNEQIGTHVILVHE